MAPTPARSFTVLNSVSISTPTNGAVTYWPNNQPPAPFSVTGTATPGVLVQVSQAGGSGDPQYVTAGVDGK